MSARTKWSLCGLLFLATLLNYLDRQTMSVSATKIAEEMNLNDEHLGQLFFAFYLSYGISQILIGGMLDRLTIRVAFAGAVAAWSLAGAAAGLATGFWSLFFLRILLGVCESPNWPLALRAVSRTFPPGQRTLAIGIFQCGTSVGTLIAPAVIIYLITHHDWRAAFIVCGLIGFVWVALWLIWLRFEPIPQLDHGEPMSSPSSSSNETDGSPATLKEILRSRALWGLLIATCFLNPLQYFYTAWLPRYFEKYANVPFGDELRNRLMVVYLALDISLLTGGFVVAWLARPFGVRRARLYVAAFGAACMLTVPAVAYQKDLDVITAILCVATFGLGWTIMIYLAFTGEVSAKKTSTAAGILGGTGSLAGAAFMLLVGGTVESSRSFDIAFVMAGVMPLVGLAGMWYSTGGKKAPVSPSREF